MRHSGTKQNFRLSKSAKRLAATVVDAHERGDLRRLLIQSELSAQFVPKSKKEDKAATEQE